MGSLVDLRIYCRQRLDGFEAELEEGLAEDGRVRRAGLLAWRGMDEAMFEHVQQTLASWQEEASRRR